MKSIKLALIFAGFVLFLVVALGWRHFFNVSTGENASALTAAMSGESPADSEDDSEVSEGFSGDEGAEPLPENGNAQNYTITKDGDTYKITTTEKITVVDSHGNGKKSNVAESSAKDTYTAKRTEREAMEEQALTLLNSGRYKECEKLCRSEWCLNSYYVDVKTIGRILNSDDLRLQKILRRDGIIDSQGRLTEKYRVRSIGGIERLKAIVEKY